MCVLSIPAALHFEKLSKLLKVLLVPSSNYSSGSNSIEESFTTASTDVIGSEVLGASKDEVIGFIKAGKNCCVFYSADPSKNDQAIATRICPESHDSDIYFHMRGIFGTHPTANATGTSTFRLFVNLKLEG